MPKLPPRLVRAWLDSQSSGLAEFDRDGRNDVPPAITLGAGAPALTGLQPAPNGIVGRAYGYFALPPDQLSFVLPLGRGSDVDPAADRIYVAGDFNGWQLAVGNEEWRMQPAELDGERVLRWVGPASKVYWPTQQRFKFVTGENVWLGLPDDAANAVRDGNGTTNRLLDPTRSGLHLWRFEVGQPLDLAERWSLTAGVDRVPLVPGPFFYDLRTSLPLGAIPGDEETVFRLFAPRARRVTLYVCSDLGQQAGAHPFELAPRSGPDGAAVWEVALDQNMRGWFYWYLIDGVRDGPGRFDPAVRVLDPYALATVDRDGPGIVLERGWIGRGDRDFKTPEWQDLVIAEAHVRDLTANAPVAATALERRGFTGLRRWVESADFYLHRLGVNCVELQPLQEFDNEKPEDYHWGYMTNNYFAPESSYALAPVQASGVRELQSLIAAFHRRGMAVLLDVVYNHVGLPAHLMQIDRLYYFEQDADGRAADWSGCGNDLRARAAMATRLIIDSCTHLIEAYGVDGFRFDLAELIGVDTLRRIEKALKRVKPDVILIAEPWSFRGHIAGALRDTGWASWNDGYRDFVRDYVRDRSPGERLEYFLRGSPWYYAKWPAQTVNYTESHDDRTWIDFITENPNYDGFVPTENDRRRTHLMAAILFMSLGIPMVAAGQDFLRSKQGVNNTYLRGDLNALDYHLLDHRLATHAYFAAWIAFRRGDRGRLLRHYSRPSEGFFQFFRAAAGGALAAVYNADGSAGPFRLLFALNPSPDAVSIPLGEGAAGSWTPVADHEKFFAEGDRAELELGPSVAVPGLGCGLWLAEE
jgi:pullulanase/glycogen debranching enzyme